MDISKKLALEILKYRFKNKKFYFPFLLMGKEYSNTKNNDFREIEPHEWKMIEENQDYKTFQLWENLQNIDKPTIKLVAKGFIEKITQASLKSKIKELAINYRTEWKEDLWESEKIEEYGLNEFIGGKAEAYEDCLEIIKSYQV